MNASTSPAPDLPDFRKLSLAERLQVFTDAGLLTRIPTRWQHIQGQVEMLLYVLMPDVSDGERYSGTPLGNMFLRQPISLANVGIDHLRLGSGLGSTAEGLFGHLMFVYHGDYPIYDMQLIQTHPDGLARARRYVEAVEGAESGRLRRMRRSHELVVPNAGRYRERFLEPGGYLDRAEALDYPAIEDVAPGKRAEHQSLVAFLDYCARSFPEDAREMAPWRIPAHLARLFTTWLRDPKAYDPAAT